MVLIAEGQSCGSSFRDDGICKKVTECPTAINALARKRMHGLNRCGFDGSIEIVCCPKSDVREFRERDDDGGNSSNKKMTVWGTSEENSSSTTKTSRENLDVKQNTRRKSEIGVFIVSL